MLTTRRAYANGCSHELFATFLAIATLLSAGARAQSFEPAKPPTCDTYSASTSYTFKTRELSRNDRYGHNIKYNRAFLANGWVRRVRFWVNSGASATSADRITISGTSSVATVAGFGAAGRWYSAEANSSVQAAPVTMAFQTDASKNDVGFSITRAQLCSRDSYLWTPATTQYETRYDGLLLSTDDTVFVKVPGSLFGSVRLVLWGAAGTNFDMFARCDAPPTPAVFDAAAISSDSEEFLALPTQVCDTGYWHVAINSRSGAGQFAFIAHRATKLRSLTACTASSLSAQAVSAAKASLLAGMKVYYGFTQGRDVIEKIMFTNGSCWGCDVCMRNATGTSSAGPFSVTWYQSPAGYGWWSRTFAHEMGHYLLGLPDEYKEESWISQWLHSKRRTWARCGHSAMAAYSAWNNGFCTADNHGRDPEPPATAMDGQSMWDLTDPQPPRGKPENIFYAPLPAEDAHRSGDGKTDGFDFNGHFEVVDQ